MCSHSTKLNATLPRGHAFVPNKGADSAHEEDMVVKVALIDEATQGILLVAASIDPQPPVGTDRDHRGEGLDQQVVPLDPGEAAAAMIHLPVPSAERCSGREHCWARP